jgi:hypothetical protein
MPSMPPTLPMVAAFLLALVGFVIYDIIIRREYREHRAEWEKDGKPIGFFWSPEEGSFFTGSFARNRTAFWWMILPPAWAKSDRGVRRLFIGLRIATVASLLLILHIFLDFAGALR